MKPFVTPDSGQRTADTLKFTNHHLPITKSLHFKPSILAFFAASPQKNIDGKYHEIILLKIIFCLFLCYMCKGLVHDN